MSAGRDWKVTLDVGPIKAQARQAAADGLSDGAEHVLQLSRRRVPIEEGTLERSGRASVDDSQLLAAVSYDTAYAVRQHEDMSLRHDDGRQAKYLESALNEARAEVIALVQQRIKGVLGS